MDQAGTMTEVGYAAHGPSQSFDVANPMNQADTTSNVLNFVYDQIVSVDSSMMIRNVYYTVMFEISDDSVVAWRAPITPDANTYKTTY